MINDMHGMFYSSDPEGTRAFLRDKLQIPHYDAGGGWLIFKFTATDMGCHPTDYPGSPPRGNPRGLAPRRRPGGDRRQTKVPGRRVSRRDQG